MKMNEASLSAAAHAGGAVAGKNGRWQERPRQERPRQARAPVICDWGQREANLREAKHEWQNP